MRRAAYTVAYFRHRQSDYLDQLGVHVHDHRRWSVVVGKHSPVYRGSIRRFERRLAWQ